MSTANILGVVGAVIGGIYGGPQGAQIGFMIGSAIGGYIDPTQIKGPKLSDASQQTSQEGIPITFGYGTFPCAGNVVWAGPVVEHEQKDDGKGSGVENITYTYTRSYAIGFCEGPAFLQQAIRNGKLVYDISPTSTTTAHNSKFLEKATIYLGDETQLVDPTIEADAGVGESGPMRGLAYFVMEDDETQAGEIAQWELVVQNCGAYSSTEGGIPGIATFYYPLQSDFADERGGLLDLVPTAGYTFAGVGLQLDGVGAGVAQGSGVDGVSEWTISVKFRVDEEITLGNSFIAGHITNGIFGYYTWAIGLTGVGPSYMTPFVGINNLSGSGDVIVSSAPIAVGQVNVITMVQSATELSMYLNAAFVGSVAATTGVMGGSAFFGVGSEYFVGSIGHLWGVTRPITEDEIIATTGAAGGTSVPAVPDAPYVYVDPDGNLITSVAPIEELSACGAILGDIVADLCERCGVESTEYDVSQLTDFVKGFKCATEAGADGYIEALTTGFFFDRGEWDKKLRFIKRGGASIANLTLDDLTDRDGAAIEQKQIQEPELLRKVNVMTIDPEASYKLTKQSAERRAGTIKALGENTSEIPIVTDADTAAGIAKKRLLLAWAETVKFKFGLSVKWAKLTPTDIVTLTDKKGIAHRMRISDMNEADGVIEITEANKDRASVYAATAVGAVNPNTGGDTTPGLSGPTLLALMNLPQMRTQDPSGIWFGMAGMLTTWPGGKLYMSVDGGVEYNPVKTVTVPTKMGTLTADHETSASDIPMQVHIFGGQLSSKTPAQIAAGANVSGVITAGVTELIAYEDATETTANYYDLDGITFGVKETTPADHFIGDQFVDIGSAYFLPVDVLYAGDTLYFKAVAFGVALDAVDPVAFVYDPAEVVIDGGEIT